MDSLADLPVLPADPGYACPGESPPISRSLHLARLAAGYAGCVQCPHRHATDGLPRHIIERTRKRLQRQPSQRLATTEGIRGQYVNDLTREKMGHITRHVLEILEADRVRQFDRSVQGGLKILTGYDSRSHSPDLAMGVVAVLKQWGCEIADMGQLSRPMFDAATDQLRPDAGLFVTGGNAPHGINGLDIIDHAGLPWCLPGKLEDLLSRLETPCSRIGRTPGRYAAFSFTDNYETGLAQHFHAIRPLRLAIVCPDVSLRSSLKSQLEQTSCSVFFSATSSTSIDGPERHCQLIVETLCDRRLDFGVIIGNDGRSCRLFDEGGHAFTVREMLALLQPASTTDSNPAWIALEEASPSGVPTEGEVVNGTHADLLRAQRERRIPLAADGDFRFWFLGTSPACDAIQTLARILEVFSLADRPASTYRSRRQHHSPRCSGVPLRP